MITPEDLATIRQMFREELAAVLAAQQPVSDDLQDMVYLASLPPQERKERLKLLRLAA